jgi:D-alanyl-lipoteichoic acid acyltransferase DltB (MBOAT superfamily)
MLFNSFEFIMFFLPTALIVYFLLLRRHLAIAAKSWLLFASLFFYCWWNVKYLPLILGSILLNYTIGGLLSEYEAKGRKMVSKKSIFLSGIVANIALLCWFKYMDFFIVSSNGLFGTHIPLLKIVLPLGISFFTITQVAFLVDAYEGLVEERNLLNYSLFVTFFPHLLAGPILHHREMMPQFERMRNKVINWKNLYMGLTLFFIGLFKKVVIADTFSVWATAGFETAQPLTLIPAWLASLSYTFQLYFDFSGYSDMAVGIGWMFNISLPVNFNSPYKATGMIDFWKRWHITLTNFVTTYLYTPILRALGNITFVNSLVAIFLAMLISGFWHGAGSNFIIWGGMHGAGLVVNHAWKKKKLYMPKFLAWFITFNFVNISFVFFRAKSMDAAGRIMEGMAGLNGVTLHNSLAKFTFLSDMGITFGKWLSVIKGNDETWIMAVVALLIATLCINSMDIVSRVRPGRGWFALLLIVAFWSLLDMNKVSEFLYFQF